jgi:enamine deaminase RidA (YjgF/YER057c/UK114 family)
MPTSTVSSSRDRGGELVGLGDPKAQATACLDNLQTLLTVHGFGVGDVRRLIVYVVGEHENLTATWAAVTAWFDGDVPPATLLGVHLLGYRVHGDAP